MTQEKQKKAIDISKLVIPKIDPTKKLTPKKTFSFNPLGNHVLDMNTSCNMEEAIAKMLGWLQSPLRLNPEIMRVGNTTIDEMPYLPELEHRVDEYLIMFREEAIESYINIDDATASEEAKQKTINAVLHCEDLIVKASLYKCALDDELIKESGSRLRIHKANSELNEEQHITLKSLCDWAKEEFEINFFENIPSISMENLDAHKVESIELSNTKAKNLYVCFAVLIDAYINCVSNKTKYLKNEKLNKDALAQAISDHAAQLGLCGGHSKEIMKDRIEVAIKSIKLETKKFNL